MAALVLELNDAGILAMRSGVETPVLESPGYAVLDDGILLTGTPAERVARLKPRFRHTRFWDALDREPLAKPFPRKLTNADLVHAHLNGIWSELRPGVREVVLVVPGFYEDEQLGLLLGVARACGMPVTAIVDSSVGCPASSSIYLDLFLHRAAATTPGSREVRTDDEVGLTSLRDAWAALLARSFVRQTRFDPLHRAETEQQLHEELSDVLETLAEQDTASLTLPASGKAKRIEITRDEIVDCALPRYQRIAALAGESSPVAVSHRLGALPGFVGTLSGEVSVVPRGEAARTVFERWDDLPQPDKTGMLHLITSFEPKESVNAPPPPRTVTHILHEGVAYAIDPGPFVIGTELSAGERGLALASTPGVSRSHCRIRRVDGRTILVDSSRYGCHVNGFRVDNEAALQPGDRLRLGTSEVELQLIEVRD
ncbi:MAG TPA: FHA domain-containing protein [Vicinamibacteria bacterium]|nr:FHA domain-containing protein [Vicinamibacteria bacterium]